MKKGTKLFLLFFVFCCSLLLTKNTAKANYPPQIETDTYEFYPQNPYCSVQVMGGEGVSNGKFTELNKLFYVHYTNGLRSICKNRTNEYGQRDYTYKSCVVAFSMTEWSQTSITVAGELLGGANPVVWQDSNGASWCTVLNAKTLTYAPDVHFDNNYKTISITGSGGWGYEIKQAKYPVDGNTYNVMNVAYTKSAESPYAKVAMVVYPDNGENLKCYCGFRDFDTEEFITTTNTTLYMMPTYDKNGDHITVTSDGVTGKHFCNNPELNSNCYEDDSHTALFYGVGNAYGFIYKARDRGMGLGTDLSSATGYIDVSIATNGDFGTNPDNDISVNISYICNGTEVGANAHYNNVKHGDRLYYWMYTNTKMLNSIQIRSNKDGTFYAGNDGVVLSVNYPNASNSNGHTLTTDECNQMQYKYVYHTSGNALSTRQISIALSYYSRYYVQLGRNGENDNATVNNGTTKAYRYGISYSGLSIADYFKKEVKRTYNDARKFTSEDTNSVWADPSHWYRCDTNGNEGDGCSPTCWTKKADETIVLLPRFKDVTFYMKKPARVGYIFDGWFNDANLTSKRCDGDTNITFHDTSTFYAKWTPIQYNVTYNKNKPERASHTITGIPQTQRCTYDCCYNTQNCAHTPSNLGENNKVVRDNNNGDSYNGNCKTIPSGIALKGWTFRGWNTEADGSGVWLFNGDHIKNWTAENNKTITLYAIWKENHYTLKYDVNKGNETYPDERYLYEDIVTLNPLCSREDYDALAWQFYSGADEEEGYENSKVTDPNENTTTKRYNAGAKVKNLNPTDEGVVWVCNIWKHQLAQPTRYAYEIELANGDTSVDDEVKTESVSYQIATNYPYYTTKDFVYVNSNNPKTLLENKWNLETRNWYTITNYGLDRMSSDWQTYSVKTDNIAITQEKETSRIRTCSYSDTIDVAHDDLEQYRSYINWKDTWNDKHTQVNDDYTETTYALSIRGDETAPTNELSGDTTVVTNEGVEDALNRILALDTTLFDTYTVKLDAYERSNVASGINVRNSYVEIVNKDNGKKTRLVYDDSERYEPYRIQHQDFTIVNIADRINDGNTGIDNIFNGDFTFKIHLEDNVKNIYEYTDDTGNFSMTTKISSHTYDPTNYNGDGLPLFKKGETVDLDVSITGYPTAVKIEFPDDWYSEEYPIYLYYGDADNFELSKMKAITSKVVYLTNLTSSSSGNWEKTFVFVLPLYAKDGIEDIDVTAYKGSLSGTTRVDDYEIDGDASDEILHNKDNIQEYDTSQVLHRHNYFEISSESILDTFYTILRKTY